MAGGYEDGYVQCPCFWGEQPSSFVKLLVESLPSLSDHLVLDAGCGEGKNAAYLASLGARVIAIDVSVSALRNGRATFSTENIQWGAVDVRHLGMPPGILDGVVMYGLLHCLESPAEIFRVIRMLQRSTRSSGFHVVCAFNTGTHDLEKSHPGFNPTLVSHSDYLDAYSNWETLIDTDSVLIESHPHNGVEHHHSLTRFIAIRP